MSVSMKPPLVVVSIRSGSRLTHHVKLGDNYGVNLLAERQQYLSNHFGGRPVEDIQPHFWRHDQVPMLEECLGYIVAEVVNIVTAGDHELYIGEIKHLELGVDSAPLIYFGGRYKRLQAHVPTISVVDDSSGW